MTSVPARGDDTGSIVFGWLGRVTLTLALIGLVGFEVLSIAVTQVGIADAGATAGDKALTVYADTRDPNAAYLAADQYVTSQGAELVKKTFKITPQSVTFKVKKTAPTLLLFRWDRTAQYAEVSTTIYEEPIVSGGSSP
jgi:hypothetical protein